MDPLVSIVIPHFNRAELLTETIESIKKQDYPAWEVIVVDDGSTEQQWNAVKELASDKIHIVKRSDDIKGPSRCRNLGVDASRGDYIVFVDSDDILAPWCLSRRLKCAKELDNKDLWVFPVILFMQQPGDSSICWNRLEGENDLDRFLSSDPPWHTSSPLWRREVFNRVGGFNVSVFYGDDSDLHTKALLKKVNYKKYPDNLPDVFIRRGDEKRITNTWSQSLIESRQIRLREGAKMLREFDAVPNKQAIWEGQYFVEAEELLFNVNNSKYDIQNVINIWVEQYKPSIIRISVVRFYFVLGVLFRKHAYFLLRITRRLAILLLPATFFPSGGDFHHYRVSDKKMKIIRGLL